MLGLSNDAIALILVSILGGIFSLISSISAFFLYRVMRQGDSQGEKLQVLAETQIKHSVILEQLVKDGVGISKMVQDQLGAQHSEIELCRSRIHWLVNKLSVIKLKCELKGFDFEGTNWEMPSSLGKEGS